MFSQRELSRQRRYPDLWSWNRSVSGQALEDYWEDASVSMIPAEWWERDSTHIFAYRNDDIVERSAESNTVSDGREGFPGINEGAQIRQLPSSILSLERELCFSMGDSHSYGILDVNPPASTLQMSVIDDFHVNSCAGSSLEDTSSLRPRCSFPPPIVSCATLSFKERGRFVLKEANIRPHRFFHAERENGRLRLQLIDSFGDDAEEISQKESYTEDDQVESQGESGLNSVISVACNENESCVMRSEDDVKTQRIFDFNNEDDDDDGDVVNCSRKDSDHTSEEKDDQVTAKTTVRSYTDCCASQWNYACCEVQQSCASDAGTSSAMQLSFVLTTDEKETMERGRMQLVTRSEDGATNGQPAQNVGDVTGGDGDTTSMWVPPLKPASALLLRQ